MSGAPGKIDPFKPVQPVIPGVPQHPPEDAKKKPLEQSPDGTPLAKPARQSPTVMAAIAIVILLVSSVLAWQALRPAAPPVPIVLDRPTTHANAEEASTATSPAIVELPLAPGPVASARDLAKSWSVVRFQIKRPEGETVPAMVVRLPSSPGYWGLLSVAPYGRCELEVETDTAKIRRDYKFAATHPMVVDSCTQTVYDPLELSFSSGVWVRGRIVAGKAIRPPFEVEVHVEKGQVIASRSE
jgi:hypothetical protein